MKYRKQDKNGDYVFGHNKNDYVSGNLAVGYAIKSKILLFYGEWWEDIGIGIPLFQSILGQVRSESVKNSAQMLLIDRIKEISEVGAVNKVEISFIERTMKVEISVTTTNNEVTEVEVVI